MTFQAAAFSFAAAIAIGGIIGLLLPADTGLLGDAVGAVVSWFG